MYHELVKIYHGNLRDHGGEYSLNKTLFLGHIPMNLLIKVHLLVN